MLYKWVMVWEAYDDDDGRCRPDKVGCYPVLSCRLASVLLVVDCLPAFAECSSDEADIASSKFAAAFADDEVDNDDDKAVHDVCSESYSAEDSGS